MNIHPGDKSRAAMKITSVTVVLLMHMLIIMEANGQIDYGGNCSTPKLCKADLTCSNINSTCLCRDTEYYDPSDATDMCKTKLNYNDVCDGISPPSSNVCTEQNTNCTSYTTGTNKCLCAGTFYRTDDNVCVSENNLKVQIIISTRGTTYFIFSWINMSNRRDIDYTITWNGGSVHVDSAGRKSVNGLIPGVEYILTVISTLPPDNNYPPIGVLSRQEPLWTYPAKPGPVTEKILSSDSTSEPFQYKISFGWPEGRVSYCTVNITGACLKNTTSPDVICSLDPARNYSYIVKCYNGNTPPDESVPVTGSFQTQPEGPGPVGNLKYIEVLEDTAKITWQTPSDPNGKIEGYLVQVKRQENGECLYNMKVPCLGCDQQKISEVNDTSCSKTETGSVSYSNSNVYILTLPGLRPYHNYTIVVRAVNEGGAGVANNLNFTTDIGAANSILSLSSNSATEEKSHQVYLNINWVPGDYTGPTTYYILVQKETGLDTKIYNGGKLYNVSDYDTTTIVVNDVLAYWNYQISVRAATIKGSSRWGVKQVQTAANRPGVVQNVTVVQDTNVAKKLSISFVCPEEQDRNGTINKFVIRQTLMGLDKSTITNYTVPNGTPTVCQNVYIFIDATDILVERSYSFSILTVNNYGEGEFGEPVTVYIQPKAPQLKETMEKFGVENLIKRSDNSGNEEKKISVDICAKCLLDDSQGTVTDVGLLVCVKGQCTDPGRKRRDVTIDFANYPTWGAAKVKDFDIRYRTTPNDWIKTLKGDGLFESFVVGGNESCGNPADFCNGPLPAGKEFIITVIACTKAGCDISDGDQVFVTSKISKVLSVGAIVGCVLGGLALIVVVICVICIILRRKATSKKENSSQQHGKRPDVTRSDMSNANKNGHVHRAREHISLPRLDEDVHVYAEPSDYDYIKNDRFYHQQRSHPPPRLSHTTLPNSMEVARDHLFPYENSVVVNHNRGRWN